MTQSEEAAVRCPCGGVILADTEEWPTPLCYSCYMSLHKDYEKLKEENERLQNTIRELEIRENLFKNENAKLKSAIKLALPLLQTYDDGKWKEAHDAAEDALK